VPFIVYIAARSPFLTNDDTLSLQLSSRSQQQHAPTTACANNSKRDLQITPKLIVRARLSPFLSPFLRSDKKKKKKKEKEKRG
jgi:hypothetical protein